MKYYDQCLLAITIFIITSDHGHYAGEPIRNGIGLGNTPFYDEFIKVAKQVIQKAKDDKKAKEEKRKKKVKTVEVEKREVKKPQGPTPQRKPKSKPTQDEYQMNVRKYRELIKQYIENPNEETLKKINKLDDIQKNDPYRNEVPLATMKKFEKQLYNLINEKYL